MARHNCAICGAEVNLMQQQKLADGNYICRKVCAKRTISGYDLVHASLYDVQAHIKQMEDGTKIYQQMFVPRKKTKDKMKKLDNHGGLLVAKDIGLLARVDTRYKIFVFGKYEYACVFRIADLYGYEYEQETGGINALSSAAGAASGKKTYSQNSGVSHYVHYYFWDTPGMFDFKVKLSDSGGFPRTEKYFNELFGIQKTLGNVKNTWKNQISAIKAGVGAAKAAISGSEDMEEKAGEAGAAMDRMQYGDRTEWIARADAALHSVKM